MSSRPDPCASPALTSLLLLVILAGAPRAQTGGAIAAERSVNEAAFRDRYLTQKEEITRKHAGKWIAIVAGRIWPAGEQGALEPAESLKACLRVVNETHPKAVHRFVFRVGEEGDVRFSDWSTLRSGVPYNLLGAGLKKHLALRVVFDARDGTIEWGRGGKTRRFDNSDHPLIDFPLASPGQGATRLIPLVDSLAFTGMALFEPETAARLGLERFEIPGAARFVDGGGKVLGGLVGRRAHVRILLPELKIDETIPAIIWPRPRSATEQEIEPGTAGRLLDDARALIEKNGLDALKKGRTLLHRYYVLPPADRSVADETRYQTLMQILESRYRKLSAAPDPDGGSTEKG